MAETGRSKAVLLAELAACTAILFTGQVALAALPNIEVVSLLVLLYTRWFRRRALIIVYAFVALQGILYGFHLWWFGYLYIWTLLWCAGMLMGKRPRGTWAWAALGGIFGLLFGFLYSPVYLFTGGVHTAIGWWIAGIPFDLLHGIGNFILILLLYRPLNRAYLRIHPV